MINESQMMRQKRMKMNQEEESHNAPLTEKPLRAGEKAEDETNTKEG